MNCILKLKQLYDGLTESDKKILDYIFENTEKVSEMSVHELADKADTSTASIVRLAKKVGYSGFGSFKMEIAKDLAIGKQNYAYIEQNNKSVDSIATKILKKSIESLDETMRLNKSSIIQNVVDEIKKSKNIYIFGVGGSALVALDFQMKLFRIGKNAFANLDAHTQLMISANVDKDDVVIGISHSGRSVEVLKCMENSKNRGAKCISLTKYADNPLNNNSDLNLYISSGEKNLREGAISSRIAMLTVLDIIYISIVQENIDDIEDKLKETREMVNYLKCDK